MMKSVIVIRYFLISVLLFTIVGCEQKIEDPAIPDHEPSYAIEAQLFSGKKPKVFISRSSSIQQGLKNINPSSISAYILRDGKRKATLSYSDSGLFSTQDTLQPGGRYKVKVEGDLPTATGTAQIPQPVSIKALRFNDSALKAPDASIVHSLEVEFKDPTTSADRYLISAELKDSTASKRIEIDYFNPAVSFQYDDKVFIKDQSFNGENFSVLFYVDGDKYQLPTLKQNLVVNLKHITDSYFQYYQALSRQSGNSGTNPFSSEPALNRGNVKNGMGCVGGISMDTAKLSP
jgi:hypothetical protein